MPETLLPLIIFSFTMAFTPGPNNIMITASGVNFGFRRTVPHILGITAGVFVMVILVGFGLAQLFILEPRLQTVLKYLGASYLLFLAWKISQAHAKKAEKENAKPIGFLQAALFQWVNPKGWVFALGTLTAYTTANGDMIKETSVIAVVNTSTSFLSVATWALFGSVIAPYLASERSRKIFNYTMAAMLVLSLVPVFWK